MALEFRHESWFEEEMYEVFRRHAAALILADGGKIEVPFIPTASCGYLRLRRYEYDERALETWGHRVLDAGWNGAFVFFKHEDDGGGPRTAR